MCRDSNWSFAALAVGGMAVRGAGWDCRAPQAPLGAATATGRGQGSLQELGFAPRAGAGPCHTLLVAAQSVPAGLAWAVRVVPAQLLPLAAAPQALLSSSPLPLCSREVVLWS